jgi:hypothetical protein
MSVGLKESLQALLAQVGSLGWPEQLLSWIVGDSCSRILFNKDFMSPNCIKTAIITILRNVVLIGSCVYKIPMIRNIIKKRGGDGLNPYAVYLETSAYMALTTYNQLNNNQFWSYADCIAATTQNIAIISLLFLWGLNNKPLKSSHILMVLCSAGIFQYSMYLLPSIYWHYIATYFIVVMTISRIPQIWANFNATSRGVQSIFTSLNSTLGATAKLIVQLNSTNDSYIITGTVLSFALNTILLLQILHLTHVEKKASDLKPKRE